MSKFHIGVNGPARCEATVRACPLGEHFDSMRQAQVAAVSSEVEVAERKMEFPLDFDECANAVQGQLFAGLSVTDVQEWLRRDNSQILGVLDQVSRDFWNGAEEVSPVHVRALHDLGVLTDDDSMIRYYMSPSIYFDRTLDRNNIRIATRMFAGMDRRTLLIAVGEDPDSFDYDDVELWSFAIHQQAHDLL